jgi:hypothetical protein
MPTLLSVLNAHADKTPDEIVDALVGNTWLHMGSIPEAVWARWRDTVIPLVIVHVSYNGDWCFNGSSFHASTWSYDTIRSEDMDIYWVRPTEGYVHGQYPDLETERQRRQITG